MVAIDVGRNLLLAWVYVRRGSKSSLAVAFTTLLTTAYAIAKCAVFNFSTSQYLGWSF